MNINPGAIGPSSGVGLPDIENLARSTTVSDRDKVAEVSRQFEAYLLRQYLAEARKTLISSDFNLNSGTQSIYADMINNQLADTMSRAGTGGLGLSEVLREQLTRQTLKTDDKPLGTSLAKTEN